MWGICVDTSMRQFNLKEGFGIRIEDTVVVTKNGCRNITKANKELTVVG